MRTAIAALAFMAVSASAQDGLGGMLPEMPPPLAEVVDPIGDAIKGLVAEIEDDKFGGDFKLDRVETANCVSRFIGASRVITVDWNDPHTVSPGDTFVFISSKGAQFAVVGDASDPDQARKLGSLYAAARQMVFRCPGDGANTKD